MGIGETRGEVKEVLKADFGIDVAAFLATRQRVALVLAAREAAAREAAAKAGAETTWLPRLPSGAEYTEMQRASKRCAARSPVARPQAGATWGPSQRRWSRTSRRLKPSGVASQDDGEDEFPVPAVSPEGNLKIRGGV